MAAALGRKRIERISRSNIFKKKKKKERKKRFDGERIFNFFLLLLLPFENIRWSILSKREWNVSERISNFYDEQFRRVTSKVYNSIDTFTNPRKKASLIHAVDGQNYPNPLIEEANNFQTFKNFQQKIQISTCTVALELPALSFFPRPASAPLSSLAAAPDRLHGCSSRPRFSRPKTDVAPSQSSRFPIPPRRSAAICLAYPPLPDLRVFHPPAFLLSSFTRPPTGSWAASNPKVSSPTDADSSCTRDWS